MPPVTNPAELFEKLFVTDSKERQARRAQENQVQASILDSVLDEANRLSKQVNKEDKDRADFHRVLDRLKMTFGAGFVALELPQAWRDVALEVAVHNWYRTSD